jgi:DNA-binding Lrp family transcriptional regulator
MFHADFAGKMAACEARPMASERSQTLDRGLRLLELLARNPSGLTITAAASQLDLPRPVVYRLAATLEERGYIRRDDAGSLQLGLAVLSIARGAHGHLRDAAAPVLRQLAETVGATAHFTVVDAGEALALAVVEPTWTDYHVAYRVGSRHPLNRGAAGRAILAGRTSDGPRAVASAGEIQPGAVGVAAPVLGVPGLEASVGVVAMGTLDVEAVRPHVIAAAGVLADRLRHPDPT